MSESRLFPSGQDDSPEHSVKEHGRIVIVSGGTLGSWVLDRLQPGDTLVGADRGALFLVSRGLKPSVSLGDFDSVSPEEREMIRRHSETFIDCDPVMKDWTDTEMAFEWALERQPQEIVLFGALGTRFDHSLANVFLLRKALDRGIGCCIVDACNEIRLLGPGPSMTLRKGLYDHVSLLPLTLDVRGITLTGFQYPLTDASLSIGQSLGISNVITGETGEVRIGEGYLLVIQSKDG
ncbi:thiamine diphosphokinase [Paenibacillus ginsengarvi]|uniref:Thiamine diphosphokinase n=1 Tax=Paenibacillus ginsengarvi TaxID=400777 RepID=A0A3B0C888_9BACL|nr:thiamine diphosphokinase [Paenibacillus ginsengarvi]RKN82132.1 thiamine diphosphokinase [Paenibacillus ginsengarvi]